LDGEGFDYQKIVQDALRDAVRRVLARVAESGLPGEHHFYVGFRTDHPGVEIPRGLREQYPEKMTVILQNQFWELEVGGESFSVVLTFHGRRERLTIPFAALTAFVDPSAEFGLRFDEETAGDDEKATAESGHKEIRPREVRKTPAEPKPKEPRAKPKQGAVVPFDPSRRK